MKKTAKKSSVRKVAAKPAAKKAAKPAAKAKSTSGTKARPAAAAPARRAGTYTPQPIEGIGWAPFRYPLS